MQIEQIDETILKRINLGDEKAFSMLYRAYYVYLNTIALYYINDENVSREIVNDIFLQVWNRRGSLTYPVHSYLIKAVQNGSIDHLRSEQSSQRALENHKKQFSISYHESYIRSTPQPLQYVELRQAEEEIQKALEQLPAKCRQIFTMYFYENMTAEEIAKNMEIKVSTVRVQLKNAFDRIKKLLEHLLFLLF
ncbi:RNA polymerase sigma-70 factor [Prevotella sp. 10(H)]|uniref:RNA polymerase sigma-70 factor n=1 Tax=Prevotella sp. 10(H) TaxID=1158294 RepID=UPI0004A6B03D|nr:RNA polymerase sigma-70 factor [Prevotella sp. 10(H)]